nr:MAG TPA_asm: hypothetical protein [Caudoviricetes sp.]
MRRTGFPQPVVSLCLLYVLSSFLSNLNYYLLHILMLNQKEQDYECSKI